MNKISWTYSLLAYIITWSITLTCYYLYTQHAISLDTLNIYYNLGALGPFVAAVFCARYFYGSIGLKKLLAGFSFKKINRKALILALSPLAFFVAGLLLFPIFSGHWYTFSDTQQQFHLNTSISYVGWLLPFITYSVLEEFGWRGFLLPHLQERSSAFRSTFILTAIWACWHLLFFLWRFQFSLFIAIGFFVSIFIGSLIITAIYNFSGGSIAATILFHFANNLASALDKQYIVAVASTGFVFLAIYLVKKYKPVNLCDRERVKNYFIQTRL